MFSTCEEQIPLPSPRKSRLQRARALTSIYGGGFAKVKRKKTRTADSTAAMIKNEIPKSGLSLSPFNPLPAIGQVSPDTYRLDAADAKFIVFDITKHDAMEFGADSSGILKPLTPLRANAYQHRKLKECFNGLGTKPKQLLREHTYDVIKPLFLSSPKVKKRDTVSRRTDTPMVHSGDSSDSYASGDSTKSSPRSRFRKAAKDVGKLSSVPETGKLLCLRQKVSYEEEEEPRPVLSVSAEQKLNKLSEIFQNLEVKGRHRDTMKKENNWF